MSEWRNKRGAQRGGDRGNWRSRGRGGRGGRGGGPPPAHPSAREMTSADTAAPSQDKSQPRSTALDPAAASRRRMNLMASVSRSSGLEKDGDDLKSHRTQEEYRVFIQEKVDLVMESHRQRFSETENMRKLRIENQENVLILFRKLREGVGSSGRHDAFATEVYETSLYLSIIFESPKQSNSIIPHLFPDPKHSSQPVDHVPSIHSTLSSLLYHLVSSYPSQSQYSQHLSLLHKVLLPKSSETYIWLTSVTQSLRRRNYAKFSNLTGRDNVISAIEAFKREPAATTPPGSHRADARLASDAVFFLIDALRRKAAETAWSVIRSAYRELSTDQEAEETKLWLARSLSLKSAHTGYPAIEAEDWLESKVSLGYVRRKEGVEGRWIVCKIR